MMIKKLIGFLLLLSLMGCSKDNDTNTYKPLSNTFADETIEIVIWEHMTSESRYFFDQLYTEFSKVYPNVKITRESYDQESLKNNILRANQSGKGPDLVYGTSDSMPYLIQSGGVQPIEGIVDKELLGKIDSATLKGATYDNLVYFVPDLVSNQIGIIYNKEFVKKQPETWEALIEDAKKFHKVEEGKFGIVSTAITSEHLISFYKGQGGRLFDSYNNPSLNNSLMISSLSILQNLNNNFDILNSYEEEIFYEGKSPYLISGPDTWKTFVDLEMKVGIMAIPETMGKQQPTSLHKVSGYGIASTVKEDKKLQAINLILDFYVGHPDHNADFALINNQMPTNVKAKDLKKIKEDLLQKALVETFEKSEPMPLMVEIRVVMDVIDNELTQIFQNNRDTKQAAANIQRIAEIRIKRLRT